MQEPTYSQPAPAGQKITLQDAVKRTGQFRETYLKRLPELPEQIRANAFSKEILQEILNQPGCDGIRIYHSVRPDYESGSTFVRELVLVGTDREGNDLLTITADPGDGSKKKGCNPLGLFLALPASPPVAPSGIIAANPRPCPHMCGSTASPLNS